METQTDKDISFKLDSKTIRDLERKLGYGSRALENAIIEVRCERETSKQVRKRVYANVFYGLVEAFPVRSEVVSDEDVVERVTRVLSDYEAKSGLADRTSLLNKTVRGFIDATQKACHESEVNGESMRGWPDTWREDVRNYSRRYNRKVRGIIGAAKTAALLLAVNYFVFKGIEFIYMLDNPYPQMNMKSHLLGSSSWDADVRELYRNIGLGAHILANVGILALAGFRVFKPRKSRSYEERQLPAANSIRGYSSEAWRLIRNKPLSFEEARAKYIQKLHKTQIEGTINYLM